MAAGASRETAARKCKDRRIDLMAKIVAGVGTSHVPAIGVAMDQGLTQEPYWKPLFDGYGPVREWMAKVKPDVVILVYNDHCVAFSPESIPTFAIGAGD